MPPPSLYAEGWRQGSLLQTPLEAHSLDLVDGNVVPRTETFFEAAPSR
jgi:hypothetical protein